MQYLFLQRRSTYPYSLHKSMRTFAVITCKALNRDAGDNAEPWRILPEVADRFTVEMAIPESPNECSKSQQSPDIITVEAIYQVSLADPIPGRSPPA